MVYAQPIFRELLLFASVVVLSLFSSVSLAARNYTEHSGYLETTTGERTTKIRDMIVVQPPAPLGPPLRDRIFTDTLNKEFRDRYQEKFGRTEIERVVAAPNRYTYYNDVYGGIRGTAKEISDERSRFSQFMMSRMAEFHIDNYMKNDPKGRVLWEAKEKISNVKVEIAEYRLDINYSLAGNTMDLKLVNPWLSTTRVRLDMGAGVLGSPEETIISLGRGVTSTISVDAHYYVTDGVVSLTGFKSLRPNLGSSLTLSTNTKDQGRSTRQTLYLAGVSYSF